MLQAREIVPCSSKQYILNLNMELLLWRYKKIALVEAIVIIIDDLMATGGTMQAAIDMIYELHATPLLLVAMD